MRTVALLVVLSVAQSLIAQCRDGRDGRSGHHGGWLIADVKITGTQAVASDVLSAIASEVVGTCVDQTVDDVKIAIRVAFQDKGYFDPSVGVPGIQVIDPFAEPSSISVGVVVGEGSLCRLERISFSGNHAFSQEELRDAFPIKKNDVFLKGKIEAGIDKIRVLYGSPGYLDFWLMFHDTLSNGRVTLPTEIHEGTQYRMGKLTVAAKPEVAEKLQQKWLLSEGAVFDRGYIQKYLDANRSLLPNDMVPERVQLTRDCPRGVVDVRVLVDPAVAASLPEAKNVECEDDTKTSDAEGKPRSTN